MQENAKSVNDKMILLEQFHFANYQNILSGLQMAKSSITKAFQVYICLDLSTSKHHVEHSSIKYLQLRFRDIVWGVHCYREFLVINKM